MTLPSAATGLVARMGVTLMAPYPDYWPEAIRALMILMIHSAEWTEAMGRKV